jgi:hypothetical protein
MITRQFGVCTVHMWDTGGLLVVQSDGYEALDAEVFGVFTWREACWDYAVTFAWHCGLEPVSDEPDAVGDTGAEVYALECSV